MPPPNPRRKRFYSSLWVQVSVRDSRRSRCSAISARQHAVAMKPLGDAFIRLITMIITVMIFCTVVTGIAGMRDCERWAVSAEKLFSISKSFRRLALVVGLIVGNVVQPGSGFNVDAATLDARAVADYAGQAKGADRHRFPDAHYPDDDGGCVRQRRHSGSRARLDSVRLRHVGGGSLCQAAGRTCSSRSRKVVFRMVDIVMRFAPIGAFGAMAFTIGKVRTDLARPAAEADCLVLDSLRFCSW